MAAEGGRKKSTLFVGAGVGIAGLSIRPSANDKNSRVSARIFPRDFGPGVYKKFLIGNSNPRRKNI